jgi:predicted dehydrogenase
MKLSRREFLERSMASAVAASLPATAALAAPSPNRAGANDILRIAVCGVKGRGLSHVGGWAGMKDVQVAALVDVDENVIDAAMRSAEQKGGMRPVFYQDYRKMLEDKSIDAISVATCNHTHTLISLTAAQAGKHVYVEKPLSHNVWEGRKLVEAARKYKVCVQHGTQSRSSGAWRKSVPWLAAGKLGKIKVSRGLCYKRRGSIGTAKEEPVPKGVDYDLWLGPAPLRPFTKNRFHYNWHWHWDYGNGDMGNQGVHEMDKARWALGKNELPKKIVALGGRFGYKDDGETYNTQICVFDYGDSLILFEVRGLETDKYMDAQIGNLVHCENGYLANGTHAFDPNGKRIEIDGPAAGGGDHFRNFIDAIKTAKPESLYADVLEGHLSSALCHLGNISTRLGEETPLSKEDPFGPYEAGNEAFVRMREHLKANGVDLAKTMMSLGPVLSFDSATEKFVGHEKANAMLTREYRKPFVVPENV